MSEYWREGDVWNRKEQQFWFHKELCETIGFRIPGALVREGIMRCCQSQGPVKPLMHNEYVTCKESERNTNFKDRDSVIGVHTHSIDYVRRVTIQRSPVQRMILIAIS